MRLLGLLWAIAVLAVACDGAEPPAQEPDRGSSTMVATTGSSEPDLVGDDIPDSGLYTATALYLVQELTDGDTAWFYATEAMTVEVQEEIERALDGYTVLFGPDWSEITSCFPDGPLPVTFSIQTASIKGDTAEVEVSIDDPGAGGNSTVTASIVDGTWEITEIIDGPHGDKAFEDC